MKIGGKDCHLEKDTAMCDSFEIDCTEETSLHTYFNTLLLKFSENRISRIFIRISSKENMWNSFQLRFYNA